jgi:hypothetical protein
MLIRTLMQDQRISKATVYRYLQDDDRVGEKPAAESGYAASRSAPRRLAGRSDDSLHGQRTGPFYSIRFRLFYSIGGAAKTPI